jgi:hypothetical protein
MNDKGDATRFERIDAEQDLAKRPAPAFSSSRQEALALVQSEN